jgi:hypothetical protein
MLRKAVDEEGKYWDRLLPYLLFAYREVPPACTGFSPFELVYGRPRFDVLKESWEASSTESVVSYVLTIQERQKSYATLCRRIWRMPRLCRRPGTTITLGTVNLTQATGF